MRGVAAALVLFLGLSCQSGAMSPGAGDLQRPPARAAAPPSASSSPPPTAAIGASAPAGPSARPPRVYTLAPLPSDALPSRLTDAVEPAEARVLRGPGAQPLADGCKTPLRVAVQGYLSEAPVHGTLELRKKRLTVALNDPRSRKTVTYRGSIQEDVCLPEHAVDTGAQLFGTLNAAGHPPLQLEMRRHGYFETDRNRLYVAGQEPPASLPALELWETPATAVSVVGAYQAVTGADDVEVVLWAPGESLLVATLGVGSRKLSLWSLGRGPLAVRHQAETGLVCEYHECNAALRAFEVTPDLVVIVALVRGQSCGAKCSQHAEAELWTLAPDGFRLAGVLSGTSEFMGGLHYEGSSSHTEVRWANLDGAPPLEILVEHVPSSDSDPTSHQLFGWDSAARGYSLVEGVPSTSKESLRKITREFAEF